MNDFDFFRANVVSQLESPALSKRDRRLLHMRYVEGATIEQSARAMMTTREGVRAIEKKALDKLERVNPVAE
jgi:DNA-directed RNA polymerase sigma subunit (sigma70/sigma32)